MQQLFPCPSLEDSRAGKLAEHSFAVPATLQASVEAQLREAQRKPTEKAGKTGQKRSRPQEDQPAPTVPCRDLPLMRRSIEYGHGCCTASDAFRRRLLTLGRLRHTTPTSHVAAEEALPESANAATEIELCQYAAREAMSLISRIVAKDVKGLLLRTGTTTGTVLHPKSASPVPDCSRSSAAHTTVELYGVFQALEIELQDAVSFPSDPSVAQKAREEAQSQILACVDALEETVLDMVVARCDALATRKVSPQGEDDERTQFRTLLSHLPACFAEVDWPSRLVRRARLTDSPKSVRSAESQAAGDAVTAILLRTLSTLKAADVSDGLGLASAPPVATLAAQAVDVENDLHPEHCSFPTLLGRTWRGGLSARGLRRAMLEAHIFFAFHTNGESQKSAPDRAKHARKGGKMNGKDRNELRASHNVTEMWALRDLFIATLEREYGVFLAHLEVAGTSERDATPQLCGDGVILTAVPTVFTQTLTRLAVDTTALTDVQQRSLRVLERVRSFDTKGWFSVPAFDLVNTDFSSLRFYVRGAAFGRKSKRSAFDALRRLFEQMVDKCVAKYGPKHEFSECISNLRHKLVDAARQEQLL